MKIVFRAGFGITFALLIYFIINYHPFRFTYKELGKMRFFFLMAVLFFIAILLERVYISPNEPALSQSGIKTYTILIQLPFWGLLGFWLARDVATFRRLLEKLAMMAAILSVAYFVVSRLDIVESLLQGPFNWQLRFFSLFGFFWYLFQYLRSSSTRDTAVGLICCALEVFVEFHKPVVVSAVVGSLVMIILITVYDKERRSALTKFFTLTAMAIVGFAIINVIAGGTIYDKMEEKFFQKYLHVNANATSGDYTVSNDYSVLISKASGGRLILWGLAFKAVQQSPWIGSGFGQVFENDFYGGQSLPVHSEYMDVLISVGISGLLILFVAIFWFLKVALSGLRARSNLLIIIPGLAFITAISTYNAGGQILWFEPVCYLTFLLVGAVIQLAPAQVAHYSHHPYLSRLLGKS